MSALADVNGQVIEVGDWAMWGQKSGYSINLNFGRIYKINQSTVTAIISNGGHSILTKTSTNLVVVEKLLIPTDERIKIESAYNERGQKIPSPKKNVRNRQRKSVDC